MTSGQRDARAGDDDEPDGPLRMVAELKELLRLSRDVELRQLLDRLEASVRAIVSQDAAGEAGVREVDRQQRQLSSRLTALSKQLDMDEARAGPDPAGSGETNLEQELQEERRTQAALRRHLDEFQAVLERAHADNGQLVLRLSQSETEAIGARHNWLLRETELREAVASLEERLRAAEAANAGLRREVEDAHQRAAVIVRDTHRFLATVRTGLHKFVRELRHSGAAQSEESSEAAVDSPSLREMLRLVRHRARDLNAASDGWMTHLDHHRAPPPTPEEGGDEARQAAGPAVCLNSLRASLSACAEGDSSVLISAEDSMWTPAADRGRGEEEEEESTAAETRTEDSTAFRHHLELLDCKLASLQAFIKQSG